MADSKTFVYDADGLVLGRLASTVADLLLKSTRAGNSDQVVIVNAEKAVVSGKPSSVYANYHEKYALCLLYTSPSPRDRTRSRMPSSA